MKLVWWNYKGIPIPLREWTWKHTLCVRVLLAIGWPPWKAYTAARKWIG